MSSEELNKEHKNQTCIKSKRLLKKVSARMVRPSQHMSDYGSSSSEEIPDEEHNDLKCIKSKRRLKKVTDSLSDEVIDAENKDLNCSKTKSRFKVQSRKVRTPQHLSDYDSEAQTRRQQISYENNK
jgi:hypothetical protein